MTTTMYVIIGAGLFVFAIDLVLVYVICVRKR